VCGTHLITPLEPARRGPTPPVLRPFAGARAAGRARRA